MSSNLKYHYSRCLLAHTVKKARDRPLPVDHSGREVWLEFYVCQTVSQVPKSELCEVGKVRNAKGQILAKFSILLNEIQNECVAHQSFSSGELSSGEGCQKSYHRDNWLVAAKRSSRGRFSNGGNIILIVSVFMWHREKREAYRNDKRITDVGIERRIADDRHENVCAKNTLNKKLKQFPTIRFLYHLQSG